MRSYTPYMRALSSLRTYPNFSRLFAFVHVLCWSILVWQRNRIHRWTIREGITNVLYKRSSPASLRCVRPLVLCA